MFDVVIVVYNKQLTEVCSLDWLDRDALVERIFVCDNSDCGIDNSMSVKNYSKIDYLAMGGNQGLSKAYNKAFSLSSADYICIMDDDTCFQETYLAEASKCIEAEDADVYIPIVEEDGVIYSPCLRKGPRFVSLPNLEALEGSDFSAINSGTIIRRNAFQVAPYDERLFLDFVDHEFISDVKCAGKRISVMKNVHVDQRFSFNSGSFGKKRYEIFKKDSAVFYSQTISSRLFRIVQLARKRTRIGHEA